VETRWVFSLYDAIFEKLNEGAPIALTLKNLRVLLAVGFDPDVSTTNFLH